MLDFFTITKTESVSAFGYDYFNHIYYMVFNMIKLVQY